jgi:hypothetical protein
MNNADKAKLDAWCLELENHKAVQEAYLIEGAARYNDIMGKLAQAEAKLDALRAAFKKYAWHELGCKWFELKRSDECTCGINDVLKEKPSGINSINGKVGS